MFVQRRDGLRNHLARARDWSRMVAAGEVKNVAEIAVRENLTRARVGQIIKLLTLPAAVLEDIEDDSRTGPVPAEHALRRLTLMSSKKTQLQAYERLVEPARPPALKRIGSLSFRGIRLKGFQHHLEKARTLKELWSSGKFASLREVGHLVGLSRERVCQLLNILDLAPDLCAKLDVPLEQLPPGIDSQNFRQLTALRDHDEQRELFAKLVRAAGVSSRIPA